MRNISAPLIVAGALLAGGCYRYVPTEMAAVPPGAEVRAHLTGDGIEAMRSYYGPEVYSVEGPLAWWDEGGVGLLTEMYLSRPGFPPTTFTDTVRLLPHHLAGMELRELDGKRTAGFSAATDDSGEGAGEDPEASIIFRIPLGLPFNIPFKLGFR